MFVVDHRLRRRAALIAAALVVAAGGAVVAVSSPIGAPASVSERADRAPSQSGDLAVIFDVGDVDRFVIEASGEAVARLGGTAAPGRSGSLGMRRITRSGVTVHAPPSGWLIPMVYQSLPRGAVAGVFGSDVSQLLDRDSVVMNEVTAEVTGAEIGDVIVMQSASGSPVSLEISGIKPYSQIGWAELVFTTDVADRLGATADTRVVLWGFDDRDALDAELADVGVLGRKDTKVNRSWDPPDPDDTLSTARTKAALGEPWYRFESDGSVSMHPDWKAANLTPGRELLNTQIPIRARCHRFVVDDFAAALAEVAQAGLASEIDAANANTYGGCYVPRFSRVSGQIGFLSRHTYGMALDTNTTSNCVGCRPRMHCDVVRIFRKHGLAWGGNFRRPDGMHFEWVGERRDQISYPSTYCPNIVNPLAESSVPTTMGMAVLSAGEAPMVHDHPHAP
jgi:hypothetical protein